MTEATKGVSAQETDSDRSEDRKEITAGLQDTAQWNYQACSQEMLVNADPDETQEISNNQKVNTTVAKKAWTEETQSLNDKYRYEQSRLDRPMLPDVNLLETNDARTEIDVINGKQRDRRRVN